MKSKVHVIPHSHIDLEWYWNYEETLLRTRRILEKTLSLMERHPSFTFAFDQVVLLKDIVKELDSAQRKSLRNAAKSGTFDIVGGMWVQADTQIPHGENIVRQILWGKQWIRDNFDVEVKCAWMIDTFGQCVQLPQILTQAGFNSYVFWRDVPANLADKINSEFYYESPDGSKILTHWMTLSYNQYEIELEFPHKWALHHREIERFLEKYSSKSSTEHILIPYGGDCYIPREEIIESLRFLNGHLRNFRLEFSTPTRFFESIERRKLPVYKYDFNPPLRAFDLRGTWDSRPTLKLTHRACENLLLSAEKFASFSLLLGRRYPTDKFAQSWERILFNSFHDILPGSNTDDVFCSAMDRYERAHKTSERILLDSLEFISKKINIMKRGRPFVVFNQLPWKRTDVCQAAFSFKRGEFRNVTVATDKERQIPLQIVKAKRYSDGSYRQVEVMFLVEDIPALGYRVYYLTAEAEETSITVRKGNEPSLESPHYYLKVNKSGAIVKLHDRDNDVGVLDTARFFGNELIAQTHNGDLEGKLNLSDDITRSRDFQCSTPNRLDGPIFSRLSMSGRFKGSNRTQEITLYRHLRRIDFTTSLNLFEPQVFIRTRFPTTFKEYSAWYETPYAPLKRPDGHFAAQNWVSVQGTKNGIALVNTGNPGYWVSKGILDLVLLWSVVQRKRLGWRYFGAETPEIGVETYDAPLAAEIGEHHFAYSLYPYHGDWSQARVTRVGYEVNNPLIVVQAHPHSGKLPSEGSFIETSPDNFIITAIKKKESGSDIVIRGYESEGKMGSLDLRFKMGKVKKAFLADLLEKEVKELPLRKGHVKAKFGKHKILTFMVALEK